jgi:hypothetical protein
VDGDVSGALSSIGDYYVVSNVAIVSEMYVRHDETSGTHRSLESCRGSAIDGRVLANDGTLSDLDPRFLAGVLEVLGVSAQNGAIPNQHILGQPHVLLERRARTDAAAVANGYPRSNDGIGSNRHAVPQLRRGINQRRRVDHLSTTRAIISASATTWPST